MNFTQEIKRDLIRKIPEKRCCKCALLAAALRTNGERWQNGFSFTSENEDIAAYLLNNVERLFGVQMTLTEAVRDPKHGRDKLTFTYEGERAGDFLTDITDSTVALEECCAQAYLKGAFLGGGSCTLPRGGTKTGYHLEVVFRDADDTDEFAEVLDLFQIIGNFVQRGEKSVAYIKSREAISDFLSVIGAEGALRTLEGVTAAREESNNENRVENCTAGNIDRSLTASAEQIRVLQALKLSEEWGKLTESLRETALARIENPTLSFSELAGLLEISKSCLNHRIRKLMQIHEGATA